MIDFRALRADGPRRGRRPARRARPGGPHLAGAVPVGWLCLDGAGASRLHEEVIEVAARRVDPALGKGRPLAPYGRDAAARALNVLERALLADAGHAAMGQVRQTLPAAAPRDVRELLPHPERRGEETGAAAEAKLAPRGEREARDRRAIRERQRTRVAEAADEYRFFG